MSIFSLKSAFLFGVAEIFMISAEVLIVVRNFFCLKKSAIF